MEENKDIYRIFFSWQADRSKVRSAIFEKLNEAKAVLAEEGWHIEIDQDTSGRVGTENIDEKVLAKIQNCDVFVADVTPIYVEILDKGGTPSKLVPNPNVMYESGYALGIKGMNRMIYLASLEKDESQERLPFDINHNTITNIKDLQKLENLTGWIRKILEVAKKEREQKVPEHGCEVFLKAGKEYADQIVIAPKYEMVQYVKRRVIYEQPKKEESTNSFLGLTGVMATLAAQLPHVEPVVEARVIKEEIDHSVCPICIAINNCGNAALEEIDLFLHIDTPDVKFVEDKVTYAIPSFNIKIRDGYDITKENETHSRIKYLNSGLYKEIAAMYIKVPAGVKSIDLTWNVFSRNHKQTGKLRIEVHPVTEKINIREDNARCGETEMIPYIEVVYAK